VSSSPDFRRQVPADRLPTLVRTSHGYRVFDPALVAGTRYQIDDSGTLVWTGLPAGTVSLLVLAAGGLTAYLLGDGWLLGVLWFLAGVVVGAGVAGLALTVLHAATSPERRYRARTGGAPYSADVTDRGSRSWLLCEQAERLAASRSWVAGRVDRDRRLAELLWAGVQGSGEAAERIGGLLEGQVTRPRM